MLLCLCGAVATTALFHAGHLLAQTDQQWTEARLKMVRDEVEGAGIKNPRVLQALRDTPRHLFVVGPQRAQAYLDMALPIGEGQTISPPFIVAYMTEALDPRPTDKVLEIGTGSGYQAAVLSPLVAEVYSIEIVESLGRKAAQTLKRLGYRNVFTKIGDGFAGWTEHAPFDKIIVTCSPERIPPALVGQLREGGRIVIPLGERYQQTMFRFSKVNGQLQAEPLQPTFFVPMTGRAEELRVAKDDSAPPRLLNGSFEQVDDDQELLGWYYVRQAEVVEDAAAAAGQRYLRFTNQTPGRGAQALQAVGVHGPRHRELSVALSLSTTDVQLGQNRSQLPHVEISFFDEKQAPCGVRLIGGWVGTTSWIRREARVAVPVTARLAVLAVGMFGATGEFSVDAVAVEVAAEQ